MTSVDLSGLNAHWARLKDTHLRELFQDHARAETFTRSFDDLTIDFSKERFDEAAFDALLDVAKTAGVAKRRDAMAAGAAINTTEDRAVLHMALRGKSEDGFSVDGSATADVVDPVLERFLGFADDVRAGRVRAKAGAFTDVINIGIGGSDLGPVMVARALTPYRGQGPRVHFVSNVDGAHLRDITRDLNPETTLVLIASKTFTTQETMANAGAALDWLRAGVGDSVTGHLAALSTNIDETSRFGVSPERVFGFWDWVGGRYSVWSAIGLSVALSVGAEHFRAFLAGARAMDQHFMQAPLQDNLPVLLALVGIWRRNVMGLPTVALIPYDQRLERFPAYVQQLDMESNGKSTELDGTPATATGPIIWGEPGTNAQHSFFQLVHQGTDIIPVDFILAAKPGSDLVDQHNMLVANCLAQAEALAFGKTSDEVRAEMTAKGRDNIDELVPHRTFAGNRPSTVILHETLSPFALGRLIAMFEHKVFVQGVIWGVNSYDQWGVELGKELAQSLLPIVRGDADANDKDSSTAALISRINDLNNA